MGARIKGKKEKKRSLKTSLSIIVKVRELFKMTSVQYMLIASAVVLMMMVQGGEKLRDSRRFSSAKICINPSAKRWKFSQLPCSHGRDNHLERAISSDKIGCYATDVTNWLRDMSGKSCHLGKSSSQGWMMMKKDFVDDERRKSVTLWKPRDKNKEDPPQQDPKLW